MDCAELSLLLCGKLHPFKMRLEGWGSEQLHTHACWAGYSGRRVVSTVLAACCCALVCALLSCLCTAGMQASLGAGSNRLGDWQGCGSCAAARPGHCA